MTKQDDYAELERERDAALEVARKERENCNECLAHEFDKRIAAEAECERLRAKYETALDEARRFDGMWRESQAECERLRAAIIEARVVLCIIKGRVESVDLYDVTRAGTAAIDAALAGDPATCCWPHAADHDVHHSQCPKVVDRGAFAEPPTCKLTLQVEPTVTRAQVEREIADYLAEQADAERDQCRRKGGRPQHSDWLDAVYAVKDIAGDIRTGAYRKDGK